MAILPIVTYPNEILEQKCDKVTVFDKKLAKLLDNMYDTMIEADGVGLAAPQVGVKRQIAIVDIGDDSGTLEMINPEILETDGEQIGPEGCLSFPNVYGEVKRPYYVRVRAKDRKGREYEIEAEDFFARAILHEIDHLQGILFTKKISKYLSEEELERYEEE
ncbi:peptide deformylase [Peribacillus tepidiphilus]|uniref:peptide deformylase n=1 Tax=Peribacillus tepidiphilus TaxID=2652445 RepID=UPI0035B53D6C